MYARGTLVGSFTLMNSNLVDSFALMDFNLVDSVTLLTSIQSCWRHSGGLHCFCGLHRLVSSSNLFSDLFI